MIDIEKAAHELAIQNTVCTMSSSGVVPNSAYGSKIAKQYFELYRSIKAELQKLESANEKSNS